MSSHDLFAHLPSCMHTGAGRGWAAEQAATQRRPPRTPSGSRRRLAASGASCSLGRPPLTRPCHLPRARPPQNQNSRWSGARRQAGAGARVEAAAMLFLDDAAALAAFAASLPPWCSVDAFTTLHAGFDFR